MSAGEARSSTSGAAAFSTSRDMSAKRQTIALGLTLVFGIAVGVHSGPVPETRYIKGPTIYKTHVVTETETVHASMPDSCIKAVDLVGKVLFPSNVVSTSVGKISLALQEFGRASAHGELQASNDAVTVMRAEKDKLDLALIHSLEKKDQFDTWYEQCQSDTKGS